MSSLFLRFFPPPFSGAQCQNTSDQFRILYIPLEISNDVIAKLSNKIAELCELFEVGFKS
jgi:hypothetical protein